MKRIYTPILFLLGIGLLGACSDDEVLGNLEVTKDFHHLYVSADVFNASTSDAATGDFDITTMNANWDINGVPSWISAAPTSGGGKDMVSQTVDLTVAENTSAATRSCIFTVDATSAIGSSWTLSRDMSLTQAGATATGEIAFVSSSVDAQNIPATGGTYELEITSNTDWTLECESWMNLSQTRGSGDATVQLTIGTSSDYVSRTGHIYIYSGTTLLSSLDVTQSYPTATATTDTIIMSNKATSRTVQIQSDGVWTAKASVDWLDVTPKSGSAGMHTLTISSTENTTGSYRIGYIYVSIGSYKRATIRVSQGGVYTSIEEDGATIEARGGTSSFNVSSNTDWEVSSCPDWVTCSPTTGNGSQKVTLSVSRNNSTVSRVGTITVKTKSQTASAAGKSNLAGLQKTLVPTVLPQSDTFTLTQSGVTITPGSTQLDFTDKASTQRVDIKSDGVWTASVSDSWITVTPTSGDGDATLSVSVTENNEMTARTGSINLTMGETVKTIVVTQQCKYITLSQSALQFTSTGGTLQLSVKSSSTWNVYLPDSIKNWVAVSQTSGTGDKDITFYIYDNPSVKKRVGTATVSLANGMKVLVNIAQAARYLTCSPSTVQFFAKGGTSSSIIINTDGAYTYQKEGSWFTLTKGTGNVFTITATANTTNTLRQGKITFSLTGLNSGESLSAVVKVVQANEGASFTIDDYGSDTDWSNTQAGGRTITINLSGYGSDNDWTNSENGNAGFTPSISGYDNDKEYK